MTAMLSQATIVITGPGLSGSKYPRRAGYQGRNINGFNGGVIVCFGQYLDDFSHGLDPHRPADAADVGKHAERATARSI